MNASRLQRTGRAFVLAITVFLVCGIWSVSQWLHIADRSLLMLGWLLVAPFAAALTTLATLVGVGPLLPQKPISFVSTFVVPVLHIAYTVTIASFMVQQPSPIVQLNDPQRLIAVWKNWSLLTPLGGLEAVMVGLITLADQMLSAAPIKTKK